MKHIFYKCPDSCEGCQFCNGGLALCTVCNAGECELPTDCPGVRLTDALRASVCAGQIDYQGGEWLLTGEENA